jgi:hypothetical protein
MNARLPSFAERALGSTIRISFQSRPWGQRIVLLFEHPCAAIRGNRMSDCRQLVEVLGLAPGCSAAFSFAHKPARAALSNGASGATGASASRPNGNGDDHNNRESRPSEHLVRRNLL